MWLSSLQSVPGHIPDFPEHKTALGAPNTVLRVSGVAVAAQHVGVGWDSPI